MVRGLTAEIGCYATRILKEFAAAGSDFCVLKLDRNSNLETCNFERILFEILQMFFTASASLFIYLTENAKLKSSPLALYCPVLNDIRAKL